MSRWPTVRLGEATQVIGGSTPRAEEPSYWGGDIVWITPVDLGRLHSTEIATSERRITREGYESCSARIVPPGAVVLSSRAPIGYLGIAATPLCTNQGCKSFVPRDGIDPHYLYWSLYQSRSRLQALGSGATFAEVSKGVLEDFSIVLPPLEEQRRIVARLEARLGASAAMRERMKAQAADLHKAVALTREAALDMDAFPIRTVEDVALVLGGPSVSTKGDATVAVATTACLSENGFRPQGVKRALMHSTDLPRGLILPDDLLFARSNTAELVGRVSRYGSSEPLYASDLTYRVRTVAPDVRPSYLEIVLRGAFLAGRWQNAGGASGSMKKVSMGYLRAFAFPTPPLEEQDRILARLDAVEREADAARAAIAATLTELDLFDAATLREVFA